MAGVNVLPKCTARDNCCCRAHDLQHQLHSVKLSIKKTKVALRRRQKAIALKKRLEAAMLRGAEAAKMKKEPQNIQTELIQDLMQKQQRIEATRALQQRTEQAAALQKWAEELETAMLRAADADDFVEAAKLKQRLKQIQNKLNPPAQHPSARPRRKIRQHLQRQCTADLKRVAEEYNKSPNVYRTNARFPSP